MLSHFDFRVLLNSDLSSQQTYVNSLSSKMITIELMAQGCLFFKPRPYNAQLPCMILSCGIHGDETAPIELLNALINELLENQSLALPLLIIFANLKAIKQKVRFVAQNLNRLFDVTPKVNIDSNDPHHDNEVQRSLIIKHVVGRFLTTLPIKPPLFVHLDLHTAIRGSHIRKFAILPYQADKSYEVLLIQLLAQAGINHLVCHNQATTTFSYYTSACYGASSATLELGSVNPFGCNDLACLAEFKRYLLLFLSAHFESIEGHSAPIYFYQVKQQVIRQNKAFKFNFSADTYNFTCFNKDDLLAVDGDKKIHVLSDNEYILFPNAHVCIGERALLTLVKLKTEN